MERVILKQDKYTIEQTKDKDGNFNTVLFDSCYRLIVGGCSTGFSCPVKGLLYALRWVTALNL